MKDFDPNPTKPNVPEEMRAEVNRAVNAGGGGKHRGDRRDTNKAYTGNKRTHLNHFDTPGHAGNRRKAITPQHKHK